MNTFEEQAGQQSQHSWMKTRTEVPFSTSSHGWPMRWCQQKIHMHVSRFFSGRLNVIFKMLTLMTNSSMFEVLSEMCQGLICWRDGTPYMNIGYVAVCTNWILGKNHSIFHTCNTHAWPAVSLNNPSPFQAAACTDHALFHHNVHLWVQAFSSIVRVFTSSIVSVFMTSNEYKRKGFSTYWKVPDIMEYYNFSFDRL